MLPPVRAETGQFISVRSSWLPINTQAAPPQTLGTAVGQAGGWQEHRQGQTWRGNTGNTTGSPREAGGRQGTAGRNWKRRLQHKANAHLESVCNRDMQGISDAKKENCVGNQTSFSAAHKKKIISNKVSLLTVFSDTRHFQRTNGLFICCR